MKQDRDADTGVSDDPEAVKHAHRFEQPGKLKRLGIKFALGASILGGSALVKEGYDSHIYQPDKPLVWKDLTFVERNAINHAVERRHRHWNQMHPDNPCPSMEEIKAEILNAPQELPGMVKDFKEYPFSQEWVEDMYGQHSR